MSASVELFSTSILSNHKVRHRHERFTSVLTVKKIPFVYHDLASDDDAKSRWRRKARDPQIPGLLVNNEWRGTFEEFEESVEFGELDLFLRVDQGRAPAPAPAAAAAVPEPSESAAEAAIPPLPSSKDGTPKHAAPVGLLQPRAVSANGPAAAPSHPLPFAAPGTGKREEEDAEGIITSLGADDLDLDDADVDAMLAELSAMTLKKAHGKATPPPSAKEAHPKKKGLYPELGTGAPAVPRTYIPSANAGTAPLKLARMGSGAQMERSSSTSSSSSGSSTSTSPRPARYNASQQSSKALTAEATAFAASRAASSAAVAKAVADGTSLDEALRASQSHSATVGREDPELLLASLGLADLNLSAEEAEAFLTDGTIPAGMASGGAKLKRVGSVADRARDEAGAREVARRAKELGYGAGRRASATGSVGDEKELDTPKMGTETETSATDAKEDEEKTKEDEPTTPKLGSSALPDDKAETDASPGKATEETVASPAAPAVEPAPAAPETVSSPKAEEAKVVIDDAASVAKPLAEDEEPESTPKAKELALPPVDDLPPPAAAELPPAPPIKSPTSPIKRSTTPTATSPRSPFGVQSPTSASASNGADSVRDAETDSAIALMLSDGAGGDLFAGLDSDFDTSSGRDGKPSPLQLTSPIKLSGVEAVSSPTSPTQGGLERSLSPTSPLGSGSGSGSSPTSTPLPHSSGSSDGAGGTLSKARSSSRIARPVVTPAPGARKGIDVRRAGSASSGALITPSASAGSLGRTSTSASLGAGPPRSASASFAEASTTPKKNRFSLAKFGKEKKDKAAAAAAMPISPTSPAFDASPASSSGRSGMSREERDHKTLSQILREADAAMAEFEDDDDAMSIMSRDDGLDWEE